MLRLLSRSLQRRSRGLFASFSTFEVSALVPASARPARAFVNPLTQRSLTDSKEIGNLLEFEYSAAMRAMASGRTGMLAESKEAKKGR